MIETLCKQCNKSFITFECWIKRGSGKYCSKNCKFNAMKEKKPWNKGIPRDDKTKLKISIANIGKTKGIPKTEEHRKKISLGNMGKKISKESIKKRHETIMKKGGYIISSETRLKISQANKGKFINEKHPQWKGDRVGYKGLHQWMKKNKPKPELCEECKIKKPYDLANISQKYKRDINDFRWICRSCHKYEHSKLSKS